MVRNVRKMRIIWKHTIVVWVNRQEFYDNVLFPSRHNTQNVCECTTTILITEHISNIRLNYEQTLLTIAMVIFPVLSEGVEGMSRAVRTWSAKTKEQRVLQRTNSTKDQDEPAEVE